MRTASLLAHFTKKNTSKTNGYHSRSIRRNLKRFRVTKVAHRLQRCQFRSWSSSFVVAGEKKRSKLREFNQLTQRLLYQFRRPRDQTKRRLWGRECNGGNLGSTVTNPAIRLVLSTVRIFLSLTTLTVTVGNSTGRNCRVDQFCESKLAATVNVSPFHTSIDD